MECIDVIELTIYTAADVFVNGVPVEKAIIKEAQRCKLAGGTVLKAVEGFGSTERGMGRAKSVIFSSEANLPRIIKIIDIRDRVDRILPFLESIGEKHVLVTMNESKVLYTKYLKDHMDELIKQYYEDMKEYEQSQK